MLEATAALREEETEKLQHCSHQKHSLILHCVTSPSSTSKLSLSGSSSPLAAYIGQFLWRVLRVASEQIYVSIYFDKDDANRRRSSSPSQRQERNLPCALPVVFSPPPKCKLSICVSMGNDNIHNTSQNSHSKLPQLPPVLGFEQTRYSVSHPETDYVERKKYWKRWSTQYCNLPKLFDAAMDEALYV